MSDEIIKQTEPSVQASDAAELTEKDLASVTGGDKATPVAPTEQVSLNFSKIEWKYNAQ